jgi:aconitate hydratase
MGVLPFQFLGNDNRKSLKLLGSEKVSITGIANKLKPQGKYKAQIFYANGKNITIDLKLLVNTATEVEYLLNGGILQYVLKNIANS